MAAQDASACLIFGYGSIINDESRAGTTGGGELVAAARLLPGVGWTRAWNFRSATGFTALGLRRAAPGDEDAGMNGVLFQVACASLAALDARERGYERVRVPLSHVTLAEDAPGQSGAEQPPPSLRALRALLAAPATAVWLYVPSAACAAPPSEDFPVCQTYVDVCLSGCLAWGGTPFAQEFLRTTAGWSPYYLNDAPASRRPWLHRGPRHAAIDALLSAAGGATHFGARRHPEEYAAAWLTGARGVWGVPKRNALFCGRERELAQLWAALGAGGGDGVTQVELVGLGGVGKSQLATEFCYRHARAAGVASADDAASCSAPDAASAATPPSDGFYGLVAWINAETAASIAGDLRRLAADSGVAVRDRPAAEVVEEVKARLFRAHFPWLLVFDNLELPAEALSAYLPRGGARGHVVVTSRRASAAAGAAAVRLDCFAQRDSLAFLARAAAHGVPPSPRAAAAAGPAAEGDADAAALAEALGNLPLALAMAAAYMRRADVTCAEYGARLAVRTALLERDADGGVDYPLSVASSLSLSLGRIGAESALSRAALDALAYCAPDAIGKPLLRELLRHVSRWPPAALAGAPAPETAVPASSAAESAAMMTRRGGAVGGGADVAQRDALAAAGVAAAVSLAAAAAARRSGGSGGSSSSASAVVAGGTVVLTCAAAAAAAVAWRRRAAALLRAATIAAHLPAPPAPVAPPASPVSAADAAEDLAATTDAAWALLKSFSLLVVREREASMHRLLQVVIRSAHAAPHARRCVGAAAAALRSCWRFDPGDAATWPAAAALVGHVKALARAAAAHGCRAGDAAALLTSAGAFTALALSRFSEAEGMLRDALALAQTDAAAADADADAQARSGGGGGSAAAAAEGGGDTPRVADALFELAKVLRYQGQLGAAEAAATRALAARRAAAASRRADADASSSEGGAACPRVAAALHELGVLRLRAHDAARGEALLREALAAKRAARSPPADVAATLHELAVAALNARPPRLDEAEATLRAALAAGGADAAAGGAGACAAAATLQQLGRLAMRRGRLAEAEEALRRAGALARAAYASERHVNVASCEHALGLCAAARHDAAAAAAHLSNALRIRTAVYGDAPHAELAATHGALGRVARGAGDAAGAAAHFAAQRGVLERLLRSGGAAPEARARATTELLSCLHFARAAARDGGDRDAAAALARYISALRAAQRAPPPLGGAAADDTSALFGDAAALFAPPPAPALPRQQSAAALLLDEADAPPAVAAALACRAGVRSQLAAAQRGGCAPAAPPLRQLAATLRAAVAAAADASAAGAATAAAAEDFAAALERTAAAADDGGRDGSDGGAALRGELFCSCDALRGALRAAGVRVEDSLPAEKATAAATAKRRCGEAAPPGA